jgi:hypothetical protein
MLGMKMKLTNYTISQMKKEIEEFLFIKWIESDLYDWNDPELRELWLLYHDAMAKQVNVIRD